MLLTSSFDSAKMHDVNLSPSCLDSCFEILFNMISLGEIENNFLGGLK